MSSELIPHIVLTHFNWSLARLKEAIQNKNTEYHRGAALERFRLTYDVALEAIRAFAKKQGQTCPTDEACFLWVKEKKWLAKSVDWNFILEGYQKIKTNHKINEEESVYSELESYYLILNHLSKCMTLEKE